MEHFGVNLVERKYSLKLTRDKFALISTKPSLPRFETLEKDDAYDIDNSARYSISWCQRYRELCLENYDLQMKYFDLLNYEEFNHSIHKFIKKHSGFTQVYDIRGYTSVPGYYMIVLDNYKQAYIGKSYDVYSRIRQHWNHVKQFDRTLFPMYAVNESCFSIDFFRALDTTRIFVWKRKISDGIERKLTDDFPKKFSLNRIGGDVTTLIEALATQNVRHLI